jgi:hypothetical protein
MHTPGDPLLPGTGLRPTGMGPQFHSNRAPPPHRCGTSGRRGPNGNSAKYPAVAVDSCGSLLSLQSAELPFCFVPACTHPARRIFQADDASSVLVGASLFDLPGDAKTPVSTCITRPSDAAAQTTR